MKKKKAPAAAALPDDIVEEILVRVDDVAGLFRCTTACKPWRALVARPSFLRRRWPEDSPESCSLFGFFTPHGTDQIFVPAPRSLIGRRSLGSFFPGGPAGSWFEHAEPITSRRGLLLVFLRRPVSTSIMTLAVCNPLAGTCGVLPPLKCDISDFDTDGCGILTGADLHPQKPSPPPGYFKVLVCVRRDVRGDNSERVSRGYDLLTFSSDEPSWTQPRDCFNQLNTKRLEMMGCAVVCRGMAHWLLKSRLDYYILQVSADTTAHVSFTKLISIKPETFHYGWLLVGANGTLSLFGSSCRDRKMKFWTPRNADDTAHWLCTRTVELEILMKEPNVEAETVTLSCVSERSGKLLLMDPAGVHLADLKTGATQDVATQFTGLDGTYSVPFEVDWADFFSSRLDGRN